MNSEKSNKRPAFSKDGMFNEAHPLVFDLAKQLRKNMTHAEMTMWGYLKENFEGLKFRRQHPVSVYIADFYCHKLRLIIEIDGRVHDEPAVKENDKIRENNLKEMGYTVIRFTNDNVEKQGENVVAALKNFVAQLQKQDH